MNVYLESVVMGIYAKWVLPGGAATGHGEECHCRVSVTEETKRLVEELETVVTVVELKGVRYAG